MIKLRTGLIVLGAMFLADCSKPSPPAPEVRPVRTVTVQGIAGGERVSLTGQIRAKDQASLAFRIDGRLIERRVNIGDAVQPGQVIGKLDPQILQNALRQSQANLSAAQGQLTQARNHFQRQKDDPAIRLAIGFGWQGQSCDQRHFGLATSSSQYGGAGPADSGAI